ncbi:Cytochrome P450 monooxygenase COX2 [Psilocybe cubensis]|uniref:Cytochrome P450 n=2 Tax=Psilocybe cubensis TaxID=181762 RepID=A0A8H8CF54_PSICU|nr:Cytochrome P450 monooxygenase COX2 [Psilocybe cubensis]KAH9475493.1 Cytochrome P450 monooxygenase COX2 [Psilocybe cubensis]
MSISTSFVYAALALWVVKRLVDHASNRKRAPYPPGPKPLPLIGNMLDFPSSSLAQEYVEWGKKYKSDILHAEALGNHVVILNSREDAIALLEQHAKLYSDRPQMPIFPLMGWEFNVALLPYGDEWRQHRRVCQQNFNPQTARKYESLQMEKVRGFLQSLIETPEQFDAHNKVLSVSLTMNMMYGYDIKSIHDRVIEVAEAGNVIGSRLMAPGGSLINIFPILRHIPPWVPGATSHKEAKEVKDLTAEMMRIPTEFVKKSLAEGTATSSLVTDFYEKKYSVGATEQEEDIIKNIAYTVYGAASDTCLKKTISSSGTFFCQMALHPEIQRKAQEELDRVVGSKRLPTLDDRKSLPYLEAIYRELLRFKPPLPLAVPHSLSAEDHHYKGYFIPKGTLVYPNIWAMTHDENVYPDPFSFKPERFFDSNGKLNDDDRVLAYGFGRRICVGKSIASSTLWLQIASVLACFNIEKAKDKLGNEIEVDTSYEESGLLMRKREFECSFIPRSFAIKKLILEAA